MEKKLKTVVFGVGPIGALISEIALEKEFIDIVGAIDIAPEKTGKDIGEVTKPRKKIGVQISDDAETVLSETKPEIVLHATGTYLDQVYPQLVKCMKKGANVISTCETLAYPWYRYPDLATKLDEMAREKKVSILGTGVSPGFRFDSLLAFLSTPCAKVTGIEAKLYLDAAKRRRSFQEKIGLGVSPKTFNDKLSEGKITAHTGYAESLLLTASMIGIELDEIEEKQEPIIAEEPLETEFFEIKPGEVSGIRGIGRGIKNNKEFFTVELVAATDIDGYEEIKIEGEPSIVWRNEPEIPGDIATASVVVNMIPKVCKADSGLITMKDIKLPSFTARNI
ncbi:dihydrodipicolinate reductase [candidate division MSBL1 archaeon SCGC-AAA259I09]|uniref:Dihydrodipicolinate reductase n=2 Tax=candidate division MSBL1 TaxID=215777 RepID=A0A133UUQ3_9EURY|nr:dihydrodipicolinate reductase [candidate division MSBL1 archaeon SCGC-AAA259B11]KXA97943.1 dihydrodipicolinate reductase [candidate division MSBL1 archaeon SCGC-AAA259I09]